jgi:cell division protein FtsQ
VAVSLEKNKRRASTSYSPPPRKSRNVRVQPAGKKVQKQVLFVPGSFRGIIVDVLMVLLGIAILLGIGIGSLRLYSLATTSDFFATQHVEVQGNVRLSREMVLDFAGLKEGVNSLSVSISRMEQALLDTPWVKNVSIKRHLPDSFVITLTERMPTFWVHKDGKIYYANEYGDIIAPVESKNFLALPTLTVEDGADEMLPQLGQFIRELQAGKLPLEFSTIAGVTVSAAKGLELYLDDRELRLSVATDDWAMNVRRMSLALADLARRHELGNVREVRVSAESVFVIMSGRNT